MVSSSVDQLEVGLSLWAGADAGREVKRVVAHQPVYVVPRFRNVDCGKRVSVTAGIRLVVIDDYELVVAGVAAMLNDLPSRCRAVLRRRLPTQTRTGSTRRFPWSSPVAGFPFDCRRPPAAPSSSGPGRAPNHSERPRQRCLSLSAHARSEHSRRQRYWRAWGFGQGVRMARNRRSRSCLRPGESLQADTGETASTVHSEGTSTEVWLHPSTVSSAELGSRSSTNIRSRRAMLGRSGAYQQHQVGWGPVERSEVAVSVEPIPYRAEAGEPGPHLPEVAKPLVGSCAVQRPVDVVVEVVAVGAEHTGIALDHIRIARPWRAAVTSSGIDPPPCAVYPAVVSVNASLRVWGADRLVWGWLVTAWWVRARPVTSPSSSG